MKLLLLCLGILGVYAFFSSSASGATRKPAVAGQFYPGNPDEPSAMVVGHLNNVPELPEIDGQIIALICPHAGLIYSGQIAAYSYKLLENSGIDKIILCGPAHRMHFEGISV